MTKDVLDFAGIGIGPANLSIAALLDKHPRVRASFFDTKPAFSWHPGMQLPDARLQTSCLKDLVTGADPCNPHSFLNYLVQKGRFYQFMSADMPAISRKEYADYLGWVAGNLGSLHFDHSVQSVHFNGDLFELSIQGLNRPVLSRNLCIGTGIRPHIPEACQYLPPERRLHCINIMNERRDFSGEHVAVIGGGQSGAEIMLGLLNGLWGTPASIRWLSRRPNFEPLDETPFTNLYFTPEYVGAFQSLSEQQRKDILRYQKLAADGISPDTLKALFQALYEYGLNHPDVPTPELLPGRTLYAVTDGKPMLLLVRNRMDEQFEEFRADRLLLCTGFEHGLPECMAPLAPELNTTSDGQPQLDRHFRCSWQGPDYRSVYAVNQGGLSHGIADAQLSLLCWRSAVIVNHLTGKACYPVSESQQPLCWLSKPAANTPQPTSECSQSFINH